MLKAAMNTAAFKAARAMKKAASVEIQFDEVPDEILCGSHIDLKQWTIVLTDEGMKQLANQPTEEFYLVDGSQTTIPPMFRYFFEPTMAADGLISLNITGAKLVTNYGLTLVVRKNKNLKVIIMSGCSLIDDPAIREIGLNCPHLLELNISSCPALDGRGLAGVAEGCRLLRKLDVSRSRNIQNWSLMKVFYECSQLEEVRISHLPNISDIEIRALVQTCRNLVLVEAFECPYVSDQALGTLAQNCPDADYIDIGRTDMTYRITDVALLPLGQKCESLRVLKANGCHYLTDVGLSWLSEGCKTLEELYIAGCEKITDAGLRSIGKSCNVLKVLDISGCRLVSDIGLTSVTSGCRFLKSLNCQGLYLLSDPRLSAPKKGEKVEAWQTVVGVASLEKYCRDMETLNLSGCFRLNRALQNHVCCMANLKVLNLQGLKQASADAHTAVAKKCHQLEELNLSDCGEGLTNKAIAAYATNCKRLKILNLARCTVLKEYAMKAVGTCYQLEKLDLTGCSNLVDVGILPLCETGHCPRLRFLSIIDTNVTDTGVAWLAGRSNKTIQLLALKGTTVTEHGLRACRYGFPFSEMLHNDNFNGFWPKPRSADRVLLNNYYLCRRGVSLLQSKYRVWKAKERVIEIIKERMLYRAARTIQCAMRVVLAKMKMRASAQEVAELNRQASLVTSIFRMIMAKAERRRRERLRELEIQRMMAIKIQSCYRMHQAQLILAELQHNKYLHDLKVFYAASRIQAMGRCYFAKMLLRHTRKMKHAQETMLHRRTMLIQKLFRGYKARKIATVAKTAKKLQLARRHAAAITIHRKYRSVKLTRVLQARIEYRIRRYWASIKIQSHIRATLTRWYYYDMVEETKEYKKQMSATMLQSTWRMKSAVLAANKIRRNIAELLVAQNEAAVILQYFYRFATARLILQKLKAKKAAELAKVVELDLKATIKIQAFFRGTKGRMIFKEKMNMKKGRWKELFDEKQGKRFFYNKMTGEIRYRMPQDLLDLIPRPKCDNCGFYEANLECSDCEEVFCRTCFDQVHYGGRRKNHEFRAMFDYYDKRIDYGDGDFPCTWPSEVIQDEVQGWMLRVAPIREPVRTVGNWEQYNEVEKDGSAGRDFYFNRKTFEATYIEPAEVSAEDGSSVGGSVSEYQQNFDYAGQDPQGFQFRSYNSAGYYSSTGKWISAEKIEGYYDTNGNWIQGNGRASGRVMATGNTSLPSNNDQPYYNQTQYSQESYNQQPYYMQPYLAQQQTNQQMVSYGTNRKTPEQVALEQDEYSLESADSAGIAFCQPVGQYTGQELQVYDENQYGDDAFAGQYDNGEYWDGYAQGTGGASAKLKPTLSKKSRKQKK
jgi:hypothetical protein